MDVGQKLKRWRKKADLSQAEAAEQVGTVQKVWSSWEAGVTPEVDYAEAIERLTGGLVTIRDWVRSRRKKRQCDAGRKVASLDTAAVSAKAS